MTNPPLTSPNYYYFIFVFKKGEAPPLPPVKIDVNTTIHARDYQNRTDTVPFSLRVWNRVADLPHSDQVPDMMLDPSAYELRIVDLNSVRDGHAQAIQARLVELQQNGYGCAVHYQLGCFSVA